jgi:hypothetical protein
MVTAGQVIALIFEWPVVVDYWVIFMPSLQAKGKW